MPLESKQTDQNPDAETLKAEAAEVAEAWTRWTNLNQLNVPCNLQNFVRATVLSWIAVGSVRTLLFAAVPDWALNVYDNMHKKYDEVWNFSSLNNGFTSSVVSVTKSFHKKKTTTKKQAS